MLMKKKYIVPPHEKINLIGMLIGPKGMYHRMLEQATNCLMFIKGKTEEINAPVNESLHQDGVREHVVLVAQNEA